MRQSIENHLLKKIMPFWMRLKDSNNGGFHSFVNSRTLEIKTDGTKSLVQHSRLLWTFCAMENHFHSGAYSEVLEHAYQFLEERLEDKVHGGYFWKVNSFGTVSDDRKIVYGMAFAIYGLSEYYRLTQKKDALQKALKTFDLIEQHASGSPYGYWEEFDASWNRTPCFVLSDGIQSTTYTLNTSIHLLEAYVNLYEVSKDERVYQRIRFLLDLFKNKLWDHQFHSFLPYLDSNGKSLSSIRSFGHNIEASWLIDEACEIIGWSDDSIKSMTEQIARTVHQDGYLEGIVADSFNGHLDKTQIWWVQSEALIGFYNLFQKTKNQVYYETWYSIWNAIQQNLVDQRDAGEWFWSSDGHGNPSLTRGMAEEWKTPYHNSRAILKLLERMP